VTAAALPEDLDFSDLKKKKKSAKKKTTFDLEAFEKELNEVKAKDGGDDEGADEVEQMPEIDEVELGDDPFAQTGDLPTGIDAGNEPWLDTDRDYTYQEVSKAVVLPTYIHAVPSLSSCNDSTLLYTQRTRLC
jgi:translation initiation factor 2 subunit 2